MIIRGNKKKTEGERNYESYLVIGGKGQGKSTFLRDEADKWVLFMKIKNPKTDPRVFIHDMSESRAFSDVETTAEFARRNKLRIKDPIDILWMRDEKGLPVWKNGILRHVCRKTEDLEKMYRYLLDYFMYGLVILDEWTNYAKSNPPQWQIEMLTNHRNFKMDVVFVCHQIMKVPLLWSRGDMISRIILFKTGEENLSQKQIERFACSSKLWPAYQKIKRIKPTNLVTQPYVAIETAV